MTRIDDAMEEPGSFEAGRTLWQRCCAIETPVSEAERFLDLAGLADGLLDDDDERDRVAAFVAADPAAMSDVAAGRAISAGGIAMPGGLERIIERAVTIVDDAPEQGLVTGFAPPPSARSVLQGVAQWGGLAAAIAFASWLGFAMGSGASLILSQPGQPNRISGENFLPELLDPSTGFLRDLGEGQQT
jgi:anti-sigma factor RsiW